MTPTSSSHGQRRWHASRTIGLLCIALLILSTSVTASLHVQGATAEKAGESGEGAAMPPSDADADPYAYLEHFDFPSLKKYAFDRYADKLPVGEFSKREHLMNAVIRQERGDDKMRLLRERVEEFYAAGKGPARKVYQVTIEVCPGSPLEEEAKKMQGQSLAIGKESGLTFNATITPYEVSSTRRILSSALKGSFYAVIAVVLAGSHILPRSIMDVLYQKKGLFFSTGMMLNMLSGSVLQPGALEVYVDGRLVFSKLTEGNIPDVAELNERLLDNTIFYTGEADE